MYLCDDGHDEIVYDQRNCPACELVQKISDQEDAIFYLKEKIKELEDGSNG